MARPWASQRFFMVTSAMPCSAFTRKRATQSCCPRRSGRMSANDPLFHERKSSSATTASASCRSIVRKFSRSVSKGNSVVRLSPLRRFGFFVLLRYLTPSRLSAPNSPTAPTGRRNPATIRNVNTLSAPCHKKYATAAAGNTRPPNQQARFSRSRFVQRV